MDRALCSRLLPGALLSTLALVAGCGAPEEEIASVGSRKQATSLNSILGHRVHIGSNYTSKCLNTPGGVAAVSASINQYADCTNSMTFLVRQGLTADTYQLRPESNTSLCLDVRGGTAYGGEPLQLYTCHGGGNQSFFFNNGQIQPHYTRTPAPGMCFDVPSGLSTEGLYIQQYPCHNGPNQRWRLFDLNTNTFFSF
jgi:hypothetical protein